VYIRSRPFRLLHARTMQDRGVLQLEVFSPLPDRVIWLITDIGGRVLQTSMQAVEKGVNTIMVHVTSLPPGLYFIAGKSTGNRSNMLPFLKN
jgi:hypothetical protein